MKQFFFLKVSDFKCQINYSGNVVSMVFPL